MPIRATGIATDGISVARQSLRNTHVISTTSARAMTMVEAISFIETSMNVVGSYAVSTVTPAGKSFFHFSSSALTRFTVPMAFASGLRFTCIATHGRPL